MARFIVSYPISQTYLASSNMYPPPLLSTTIAFQHPLHLPLPVATNCRIANSDKPVMYEIHDDLERSTQKISTIYQKTTPIRLVAF